MKRTAKTRQLLRRAARLYHDFTGHSGEFDVTKARVLSMPRAVVVIGECDGILYSTVRDGVPEKYIHRFRKNARPLFCVSPDGRQLLLLGGSFRFTDRGIVDNRA